MGVHGAGKSTLIKASTGAHTPDSGRILLDGKRVRFHSPLDARCHGIKTAYQTMAAAPALRHQRKDVSGREERRPGVLGSHFRLLDKPAMRTQAAATLQQLGITTAKSVLQQVETLSGGQRQAVAVARAAAWQQGSRSRRTDRSLGVREAGQVLGLIRRIRDRGVAVILISHNMPQVLEVADRIHIHRLGQRIALV